MKSRNKKLLSDVATFSISNFASKVLVFLMVPLYTHVLSAEEFGIADLMTSTLNILSPLLTLAITQATMRFLLDKNSDKGKVLGASLLFIGIGFVVLLLATPFVQKISAELSEYWGYFLALYLLGALNGCQSNYIRGTDRIRLFAIKGILHTATTISLNIIFLLVLRTSVKGYLAAMLLSDVIVIVFGVIACKMWQVIPQIRLDKKIVKEMLQYSVPMMPTIIAWWVMQTSDKYVVIAVCGIAASGLYSVAYKIPSILSIVTSIFNQAWQISAVKSLDDTDYNSYLIGVYRTFFALTLGLCSALICASELLGKILFAGEFFTAWTYVPILLVAYFMSGLSGVMASIFTARKRTSVLFYSTLCGAVLNLVLNILLIPVFGVVAAAATTALGFFVTYWMRNICVTKYFGLKMNGSKEILMACILVVQAVAMSFGQWWGYVVQVVALAVIALSYRNDLIKLITKIKQLAIQFIRRKEK